MWAYRCSRLGRPAIKKFHSLYGLLEEMEAHRASNGANCHLPHVIEFRPKEECGIENCGVVFDKKVPIFLEERALNLNCKIVRM